MAISRPLEAHASGNGGVRLVAVKKLLFASAITLAPKLGIIGLISAASGSLLFKKGMNSTRNAKDKSKRLRSLG
jgi:hypothetical protein